MEESAAARPLRSLGRDEMNLAEFPITLLTDRVPKDQKEAVYRDEIFDDRTGRTLTRKLTISAGNYGLTTAVDDEIILALIQLTKSNNDFTNRKVDFTRNELIEVLGWQRRGESYDRILLSLRRWTSVYLDYENAWRDNRTKKWRTTGFHIIEKFEINDSRTADEQLNLLPSFIIWSKDLFESFQAGYLKPLDYDFCMGLSNSTARRMYRFLDKRFYHKPDWRFGLKEFAHDHIGLSRKYEGPAHLRRKLQPAIQELERVGFLVPLDDPERFERQGKEWMVRFVQKTAALPVPEGGQLPLILEPPPCPLTAELTARGVTGSTAEELIGRHPSDRITTHLEVFDWLTEQQDKRIAKSPAGYLVASIQKDFTTPKGFLSRAERAARAEVKRQKDQEAAAAKRLEREREEREREEDTLLDAYWQGLSAEEQAALDASARQEADPEMLALADGPMKRIGQTLCRRSYIRKLLEAEGKLPLPQ